MSVSLRTTMWIFLSAMGWEESTRVLSRQVPEVKHAVKVPSREANASQAPLKRL